MLRSWNTSYERKQLDDNIQILCHLIIYLSANDGDSDDDLSSLSSESSESSGSSLDISEDSETDDKLELVEMSTECVMILANQILNLILVIMH